MPGKKRGRLRNDRLVIPEMGLFPVVDLAEVDGVLGEGVESPPGEGVPLPLKTLLGCPALAVDLSLPQVDRQVSGPLRENQGHRSR